MFFGVCGLLLCFGGGDGGGGGGGGDAVVRMHADSYALNKPPQKSNSRLISSAWDSCNALVLPSPFFPGIRIVLEYLRKPRETDPVLEKNDA